MKLFDEWMKRMPKMIPGINLQVDPERAYYYTCNPSESLSNEWMESHFQMNWDGFVRNPENYQEWLEFQHAWGERFGVKKSLLGPEIRETGWYLCTRESLGKLCLRDYNGRCAIDRSRKFFHSKEDLILAVYVENPNSSDAQICQLLLPKNKDKLIVGYGWHGIASYAFFWAIEESGLTSDNELSPFFVELPGGPGSVSFQRAMKILKINEEPFFGQNPESTIVYLNWIFAFGNDNALQMADDALSGRKIRSIAKARRITRACL